MARILKGTRARGLPPKVLLSRRQDATGSFPTVWRTASDNRTGKYPVFFNDNKVIPFNQPAADVGFYVSTYPEYEEKVVIVGSPGNPKNESDPIVFDNSFSGTPIVIITEITSNPNTPTVNAFVSVMSATGSIIGFSAPFEGTFVYRAIYQTAYGNPVNVLRSPRYTDQYSLVVAENNIMSSNTLYLTFSDFGSTPTENYITFWDYNGPPNNTGANLSGSVNSTYITNTSFQVTASAQGGGSTVLHYMGFGASTASIDVKGIVYPLVMTPQAINAGLSTEDKSDLFKQPYFSGSEIVNQPIVASGSMVKGVSDLFVTFTPGQDVEPFMDFANPEGDAKSLPVTSSTYQFYATGSAVTTTGTGFQQPLWSKNKIEIDITPAATQTINAYFKNTFSNSYPMFYWNPVNRQYEGIGDGIGLEASNTLNGLKKFLQDKTVGFGGCIDNGGLPTGLGNFAFKITARPISNFGFPYHPKFEATSSQLINMSDYISEPFLLEKLVIETSASVRILDPSYDAVTNSTYQTFFILNQRPFILSKSIGEQIITYTTGASALPYTTSFATSSYSSQTYRDLVDYAQIAFYRQSGFGPLGLAQSPRELNFLNSPNTIGPRNFIISSSCKSPIKFEEARRFNFSGSFSLFNYFIEQSAFSGRNGVYDSNGREWVTSYENPVIVGTASYSIDPGADIENIININEQYTKLNPYILLPTDKLIFGGQLPLSSFGTNVGDGVSVTFFPSGVNKIILYGSTLRLNPETNELEEHHDTLNQLLCSNSVHEILG